MIAERLQKVRDRIDGAALQCGRDPSKITLVAVSKLKPASEILAAYEAGQRHFGESYVQEFQRKSRELGDLPWAVFHLIGRLQSNKTKAAATLFHAVHTVDSLKIARRLGDQTEHPLDVFFEVRLSPEETKSGVAVEDLAELVEFTRSREKLRPRGLMTMPPWSDDPEASRPYFRELRELAERHELPDLSMGMSHDLEVAVEEGSTFVRVGTAIFGPRKRRP